jgi:hypothetical protein
MDANELQCDSSRSGPQTYRLGQGDEQGIPWLRGGVSEGNR